MDKDLATDTTTILRHIMRAIVKNYQYLKSIVFVAWHSYFLVDFIALFVPFSVVSIQQNRI